MIGGRTLTATDLRKIFVAGFETQAPVIFGLLLVALLILGVVFFLVGRIDAGL